MPVVLPIRATVLPGHAGLDTTLQLFLTEITFNHDPASAETSALNIRKNEQTIVNVPEWRNGSVDPQDSPAAYAIAATDCKTISIKARFSSREPPQEPIFIRAIPLSTRGTASARSLGRVLKTEVRFNGSGETEPIRFDLADVKLKELGVGVNNVRWRWQFCAGSCDDQADEGWVEFATTAHRIYRVIDVPSCPWVQMPFEPANIHLPWTEVLDYACIWADSAHTADEAARLVTHGVYDLGLAKILTYQGGPNYTGSMFDCTAFLHQLRGEVELSKGPSVNCTDCATIVSTFANAVGCDLSQSRMGSGFEVNPHLKIGHTGWQGDLFGFHELAWKGECTTNDEVFDACLILDGDDAPTVAPPQIPLLATNLLFGELEDRGYRFRLAPDGEHQNCQPRPETKTRRQIGAIWTEGLGPIDEELLRLLAEHYEFDDWKGRSESRLHLFVREFKLRGDELPGLSLLRQPDHLVTSSRSLWQESFWRAAKSTSEILLRIDTYTCATAAEARQFLLLVLSQFEELDLLRRDGRGVGDVAFADGQYNKLLFTLGNLVCVIRNVGSKQMPVYNVARALNDSLMLGSEHPGLEPPPTPLPTGADIKLEDFIPELAGSTDPFKIFSDAGEVLLKEGRLIYRPTEAAEQNLTAFIKDGDETRRLRFRRG